MDRAREEALFRTTRYVAAATAGLVTVALVVIFLVGVPFFSTTDRQATLDVATVGVDPVLIAALAAVGVVRGLWSGAYVLAWAGVGVVAVVAWGFLFSLGSYLVPATLLLGAATGVQHAMDRWILEG